MTHSSAPNTPNIPPPPEPPTNDPSRNKDEWIAVLVALLAMGGIFFWATGTDRKDGLLLGRRSSSSTQVEDLPSLSGFLEAPLALDNTLSSQPLEGALSPSEFETETTQLQPRRANIARRTGLVLGGGSLFGARQTAPTTAEEATTEEGLETPVEGETPLEATDTETPVEAEASETAPEVTEEETTEEVVVVPTDEAETPETEAEKSQDTEESVEAEVEQSQDTEESEETTAQQSEDTEEPEEATAQQSQRPRFGIPFFGNRNNSEETETPTATEEEPTEAVTTPDEEEQAAEPTEGEPDSTEAATAPDDGEEQAAEPTEGEPDSTEAATAPDDGEEQAAEPTEGEPDSTEAATAPEEEEETAAAKPNKPSLGFSIPGFGGKKDDKAASSAEFSDVPDDFWAKDYVQYFVQQDIITGYEDGTFKPEEPMSRAAVAAQIEDSFGFAESERDQALSFEDVGQEYWAESAIDETTKTGFLTGYPGDVFRPEKPMTRTEVLVAIVSGLNLKPSGDPEEILSIYQDADQIPEWAVEKVAAATEAGLVVSYPNTDTFNPNEPASRAEVSAMLYQALVEAGKVDPMSSEYIINPKK